MNLTKPIKALVNSLGVDVVRYRPDNRAQGYQLYRYLRPDGSFDYERYKKVQTEGNKAKLGGIWAMEENLAFLADYIRKTVSEVEFGLCHGTRQGKEQEWFKKYLNCRVLGTEISDTAARFPDTIQWDFHQVKPEWVDSVDFIYSNSFDHSYSPEKCLNAWMSCIKGNGICILEHTSCDERACELDPFGAPLSMMPFLVLQWGKGKFFVREILDAPGQHGLLYNKFLIIQKKT